MLFGAPTVDVTRYSSVLVTVYKATRRRGELLRQVCGGICHQYSCQTQQ